MKSIEPTKEHEEFHKKIRTIISETIRSNKLTNYEVLAIMGKLCGMVLALQDQKTFTREELIETLSANIELGNEEFIEAIFKDTGTMQ